MAVARYRVEGVAVALRQVVTRREARLPYGYETRELMVVPEIGVRVHPASAIVPLAAPEKQVEVEVGLVNGWHGEIDGELTLRLPEGWTVGAGVARRSASDRPGSAPSSRSR